MSTQEHIRGWLCNRRVVTVIILQSSTGYHPVTTQKEVLQPGHPESPQGHALWVAVYAPISA